MTGKQIEKAREEILARVDKTLSPANWPEEDQRADQELDVRNMINSMLIYGDNVEEGSWSFNKYLAPYFSGKNWRNKGLITRERLLELIEEQKADFAKAEVGYAGEDSEGYSYNYCKWADEF